MLDSSRFARQRLLRPCGAAVPPAPASSQVSARRARNVTWPRRWSGRTMRNTNNRLLWHCSTKCTKCGCRGCCLGRCDLAGLTELAGERKVGERMKGENEMRGRQGLLHLSPAPSLDSESQSENERLRLDSRQNVRHLFGQRQRQPTHKLRHERRGSGDAKSERKRAQPA